MTDILSRYLNTRQAAAWLGIGPGTLNRMRVSGDGPRYIKIGRRVIYDRADLGEWVEERKRRFTGEACAPDRPRADSHGRAAESRAKPQR